MIKQEKDGRQKGCLSATCETKEKRGNWRVKRARYHPFKVSRIVADNTYNGNGGRCWMTDVKLKVKCPKKGAEISSNLQCDDDDDDDEDGRTSVIQSRSRT
jgi:hypothetical protein